MAMSKCKECGKAVSTLAKTCPNCGVPKPALKIKIKKKIAAKTKRNKPHGLSTKKTSNQQYEYNPKTGSFDKSSSKIKNEENYDPKTGSFERESKKTRILKANDKINEEEQARRQDEFRRNKQYWKDQEQIRKQDELRRKEEDHIRVQEQQRRVADETIRRHEEQRIRKEEELRRKKEEQISTTSVSSSSTNTGKKDIFDQFSDGTLDLATAFWGFFTFGSFIVGVICAVLSEMVSTFFNVPYVLITAYIIISTGNCAENYKKIMIKKNQSVVWGVLTQIFCVVSFLGLILFVYDLFKN